MVRWDWLGGALVVGAIGAIGAWTPGENRAGEIVERLGGRYQIEPRLGLDCLGVIVKIELADCTPTAADLAEIGFLRHLRVLDLSLTPIRDRELAQLAHSSCGFIIVPEGQTSRAVREMVGEERIALGISLSKFGKLSDRVFADPLDPPPDDAERANRDLAAKRAPWRSGRRPAGARLSGAAVLN